MTINFHVFVFVATLVFVWILKQFKKRAVKQSDKTNNKTNSRRNSQSNLLFVAFVPIVLYSVYFYYNVNQNSTNINVNPIVTKTGANTSNSIFSNDNKSFSPFPDSISSI